MDLYPIMINLQGRRVAVIGAGEVALRKVADLLQCGALVRVVAPVFHEDFRGLADEYGDSLVLEKREYRRGDIGDSVLVFSATNDAAVNAAVFGEAQERNILINAVDDPPNCSFFIPSSYRKGDLVMTLSTSGASPAMAARLRRELQRHIPEQIDTMLAALREARELLKSDDLFPDLDTVRRGEILKSLVGDDVRLDELGRAFEQGSLVSYLNSLR